MSVSPLQLGDFRLNHLLINANNSYVPDSQKDGIYEIEFNFAIYNTKDNRRFKIPLIFELKAQRNRNQCKLKKVEIEIEGIFNLSEDVSDELMKKLVPFNCLAILYGIARGIVSNITGNTSGGKFILPAINFYEAIEKKIEELNTTKDTDKQ